MINRIKSIVDDFAAEPVAHLIVAICVASSAAIGVLYVWDMGRDLPLAFSVVLSCVVLAVELIKSFYLRFTWMRGLWGRGLLALPLFVGALLYSMIATHSFAERHLIQRDWSARTVDDGYLALEREVAALDARLAPIAGVRSAAVIQAEIDGLLLRPGMNGCAVIDGSVTRQWCPVVAERRAELARAAERDRLIAELSVKRQQLLAMPKPSHAGSDTNPVTLAVAALTGVTLSVSEIMAKLIMILIEAGSFLAPATLIGARAPGGGRPGVRPLAQARQAQQVLSLGAQEHPGIAALLDDPDPVIVEIGLFLVDRTEGRNGAWVTSEELYDAYCAWKRAEGGEPVSRMTFGRTLSRNARLRRDRRTVHGVNATRYEGLVMKPMPKPAAGVLGFRRPAAA